MFWLRCRQCWTRARASIQRSRRTYSFTRSLRRWRPTPVTGRAGAALGGPARAGRRSRCRRLVGDQRRQHPVATRRNYNRHFRARQHRPRRAPTRTNPWLLSDLTQCARIFASTIAQLLGGTVVTRRMRIAYPNRGVHVDVELLDGRRRPASASSCGQSAAGRPAHHAVYSGSEIAFNIVPKFLDRLENMTSRVLPGDVGYWFLHGRADVWPAGRHHGVHVVLRSRCRAAHGHRPRPGRHLWPDGR